jgi:nucleoid-associated protein YgaU
MSSSHASARPIMAIISRLTLLLGALVALVGAGRSLPAPPSWAAHELRDWVAGADPVVVVLTGARWAALVATAYLLTVVLCHGLATAADLPALRRGVERATVPALRRLLPGATSVIALVPVAAPALAQPPPSPQVVETGPAPIAVMRVAPLPERQPPQPPATWTVQPGDHLWDVSRRTLEASLTRPPTEAEIASYLDELVALNQQVLAVPGLADLVFAGQIFVLPPAPQPPR